MFVTMRFFRPQILRTLHIKTSSLEFLVIPGLPPSTLDFRVSEANIVGRHSKY